MIRKPGRKGRCGRKRLGVLRRNHAVYLFLNSCELELLDSIRGRVQRGRYCARLIRQHVRDTADPQAAPIMLYRWAQEQARRFAFGQASA